MNCNEIEKYLPLYPEEVEPGIKGEIELHLKKCSKCKALYDSLGLYSSYALSAGDAEAPENFETSVISKLESGRKKTRIVAIYKKTAIVLGSAAAILVLLLLFLPEDKPWEGAIEANFALQAEKKGKGPAGLIDIEKTDESISKILRETGAVVEMREDNPVTGYYDFIIAGIPGENLGEFIKEFNRASATKIKLRENGSVEKTISYVKIYFDMISFTAANFDGDGHADLIVQFLSGRHKGKWMIYINTDSTHFTEYQFLDMGKNEAKYLGDNWMLAGDFNGDRLDDICLYKYSQQKGLSFQILLNHNNFKFRNSDESLKAKLIPPAGKGQFFSLIAGDTDGDGRDELLRLSTLGEDLFEFTIPGNIPGSGILTIPEFNKCSGNIFGGDMNGDDYVDLCVKYQQEERAGQTWIYLNTHQGSFSEPQYAGLSFVGDYLFLTGDYTADGLDDLFVKSGGLFFSGDWCIMQNEGSGKLIFEKEFKLTIP